MKTSRLNDRFWVAERLQEIKDDKQRQVSYHLLKLLEEKGLLTPIQRRVTPGRGKPRKFYVLSPKGTSYLNLSKGWKRPVALQATAVEEHRESA